jgi:DNA-binding response OmpR family regulator
MTRILVADDQPNIRKLIRLSLPAHYQVLEAATADEALTGAALHRPHIMVLDVMMPGTRDGLGVLQAIRAWPMPQPRVVMVSALGQQEEIARGLALGANAYLVKPFRPSELIGLLEGWR